jgi:hypothetical protein
VVATAGVGDPFFDAVRILLLIDAAGSPLSTSTGQADDDLVAVVQGEARLQKLDFWLRYPDYLAYELLNDFDESGEDVLLDLAAQILDSEEPELRKIPMLRYKFGAYEPLDMALSILVSEGLVVRQPALSRRRIQQVDFFLTRHGRAVAASITDDFPVLDWYRSRSQLVAALADGTGLTGTSLRKRQYLVNDYRSTDIGDEIGSIADRGRSRLTALRGGGPGAQE